MIANPHIFFKYAVLLEHARSGYYSTRAVGLQKIWVWGLPPPISQFYDIDKWFVDNLAGPDDGGYDTTLYPIRLGNINYWRTVLLGREEDVIAFKLKFTDSIIIICTQSPLGMS